MDNKPFTSSHPLLRNTDEDEFYPTYGAVLSPIAKTDDLHLPKYFWEQFAADLRRSQFVYLHVQYDRNPNQGWKIACVKDQGELFFRQGWREFMKHHNLGPRCTVVFYYLGRLNFYVTLHGPNSCWNRPAVAVGGSRRGSEVQPIVISDDSSDDFSHHSLDAVSDDSSDGLEAAGEGDSCTFKIFNSIPTVPKDFFQKHINDFSGVHLTVWGDDNEPRTVGTFKNNQSVRFGDGWRAFMTANNIKRGNRLKMEVMQHLVFRLKKV